MLEYMQYRFDITRDGQFQVIELLGQSVYTIMHIGVPTLRTRYDMLR